MLKCCFLNLRSFFVNSVLLIKKYMIKSTYYSTVTMKKKSNHVLNDTCLFFVCLAENKMFLKAHIFARSFRSIFCSRHSYRNSFICSKLY
jgi:hypothetical protein